MKKLGLRERKKQRTREALIEAALELFCANGYEATTVDQIAAAVEVSSRTFFRYFGSKQDIALALVEAQISATLSAFADQPADVPILTALRCAVVSVVRQYETGAARYQPLRTLISDSPALTAARFEQGVSRLDEIARLIAARMAVDPATDPRPALVAAVVVCAVPTTIDAWRAAGRSAPESTLIEDAFDLLSTGLDYPTAASRPPGVASAGSGAASA